MTYSVLILRRAQKELARIPIDDFRRICDAIRELKENPRPPDSLKLSGREGWRIRVGNYRVIYEIEETEKEVTVLHVGHRKDVYK